MTVVEARSGDISVTQPLVHFCDGGFMGQRVCRRGSSHRMHTGSEGFRTTPDSLPEGRVLSMSKLAS
jgi:hypothetical protein